SRTRPAEEVGRVQACDDAEGPRGERRWPKIDPPEVVELLRWASRSGFTMHIAGRATDPHALVLVRFAGRYIDVAHLRGADRTEVARIPRDEHANIWHPKLVTFHYYGGVLEALQALKCPRSSGPRAPDEGRCMRRDPRPFRTFSAAPRRLGREGW